MAVDGPRRSSALPRLLLIAAVAAAIMVVSAASGRPEWVTRTAALVAIYLSGFAILANIGAWGTGGAARRDPYSDVADNTALTTAAYTWGALAMQGLYLTPLTGLRWQHGWQYALAMLLLAVGSLAYERRIRLSGGATEPTQRNRLLRLAMPLAAAQGMVAGIGLVALLVSGKLWSERADWAANRVFAALAVSILVISVVSLIPLRRLGRWDAAS